MGLLNSLYSTDNIEKQMGDCKDAGPDLNSHQNFEQKGLFSYVFYALILWLLPGKAHKANFQL